MTRQIEALGRAGVEHISLIGRWSIEERAPAPVFADAIHETASLGALYTALLIAPAECTIVLAGDMPFIGPQLLDHLSQLGGDDEAVIPRTGHGPQPLCGAYRRSVALRLKAQIDLRRPRDSQCIDGRSRPRVGCQAVGSDRSRWHDADEREYPRRL